MGESLFSNIYYKFIQLALNLKYILKIFIEKSKHKLILRF